MQPLSPFAGQMIMEANQVIRRFSFLSAVLVAGLLASGITIAYADGAGGGTSHPLTATPTPGGTAEPTPPPSLQSISGSISGRAAGAQAMHTIMMPDPSSASHVKVTLRQVNLPCLPGRKDGQQSAAYYVQVSPDFLNKSHTERACVQEMLIENTERTVELQVVNYHDG